jgi:predicted acetyltransferase
VSLLFFMEDENMLWAFSIWHHTNHPDFQAWWRSYISYGLRPSARDKWYTKEMLRLGLIEATKLGIKKVVISADEDNPVSWKTIESCGWILQKIIIKDEKKMKIYHLLIY